MMKKKTEFKKIVLGIILVLCFGFVFWSYILASVGSYAVNEGIANALIYTVIASYVSYVVASFGEKNSRNKYDVDVNGNKRGGEKGDD